MFLIIWGIKSYATTMAVLNLACRNGHVASHRLVKVTRKFTMFFIPLFPVGRKYFTVCAACGLQVPWDKESAEAAAHDGVTPAGGAVPFDPVAPPVDTRPAGGGGVGPVPPGWYADPAGGGGLRYWDGGAWTEAVHGGSEV